MPSPPSRASSRSRLADPTTPKGQRALEATERILAYGYSEVSQLSKGCDNVWRALAFAEGDPVNVLVTPRGDVLTE